MLKMNNESRKDRKDDDEAEQTKGKRWEREKKEEGEERENSDQRRYREPVHTQPNTKPLPSGSFVGLAMRTGLVTS